MYTSLYFLRGTLWAPVCVADQKPTLQSTAPGQATLRKTKVCFSLLSLQCPWCARDCQEPSLMLFLFFYSSLCLRNTNYTPAPCIGLQSQVISGCLLCCSCKNNGTQNKSCHLIKSRWPALSRQRENINVVLISWKVKMAPAKKKKVML